MTVWHSDMFGRNDFLGELMLPLQGQIFDDPSPRWYGLQDRVRIHVKNGADLEWKIHYLGKCDRGGWVYLSFFLFLPSAILVELGR